MESLNEEQFTKALELNNEGKTKILFDEMVEYVDSRLDDLKKHNDTPVGLLKLMQDLSNIGNGIFVLSHLENEESDTVEFKEKKHNLYNSLEDTLVELDYNYNEEYKKYINHENSLRDIKASIN